MKLIPDACEGGGGRGKREEDEASKQASSLKVYALYVFQHAVRERDRVKRFMIMFLPEGKQVHAAPCSRQESGRRKDGDAGVFPDEEASVIGLYKLI